ncbi:MAG: MATE family efflux transporter [Clostridiales bacterium]|nr:MATE family efflux transporter [Clostridiales bacterium]
MEKEQSINKMGIAPIKKLMLSMGMPMILSMMVQAFYNIVDSYFVAAIPGMGDSAMNALTLAFPVQMLMIAVGVGTGVGVNSILSCYLGEGNREKAGRVAGNALFIGVCTYLVFLVFGVFGVDIYLRSQTSDPVVLAIGREYLTVCMTLSFGAVISMIVEKLLQSTGKTMLATAAQLVGAVLNIILDPVFIFGWCGMPEMGATGAAVATVVGQIATMLLGLIFHYTMNKEIDGSLKYLKPRRDIIAAIYTVGAPAIVMQALMSVMAYGINVIFGLVSAAVVTAFGIYYKIQQFVFFAAFGLNNAMIPIIAFNYGMGSRSRVNEGIKYGMLYTVLLMLFGMLVLQVFAKPVCGLFAISGEIQALCIKAIRIVTVGYAFAGANIAFQGIFQALGSGVKSLIVSLMRLIVVNLPLAWLLTTLENAENLVWLAFPAAEAAALVVALGLMRSVSKNRIAHIE